MSYNTGISATLVFSGGITYSGRFRSVGELERAVEALDDTALSNSSGHYEVVPDDLARIEAMDVEVYFDGTKNIPLKTVGTITLTFPTQPGQSSPASISGSGFIARVATPELAAGERLVHPVSIQFDGKTGPAITVAT